MAQNLSHACLRSLEADADTRPALERRFTEACVDSKIRTAKYAVRGAVPCRAAQIGVALKSGEGSFPFDRLIFCNIGNPHAVQQKPITFYRQVAAATVDPTLLTANVYPKDVVQRASEYLAATNGSGIGAYTDSSGLLLVRQQIAAFLEKRDGFPADVNRIYLTTGASEGVKRCISALITNEKCGIMIPRPQYPLYSAALTMTGGAIVYYDLFEEKGWSTHQKELEAALSEAHEDGTTLRAIAVINPGNPVGAVMNREAVAEIITFATLHKLVVLADEVYQENVYAEGKEFHSFKKVLRELQSKDAAKYKDAQLISFHSTSKGIIGECGQRGGYMEFVGFSDRVMAQFTKMAATSLSSSTLSQIFVGLMVKPPAEGEPSYDLFEKETSSIFAGLRRRASRLTAALSEVPGIRCQAIEGAMYAFPRIELPEKAVQAAKEEGCAADEFWCLQLLEATGVVTVPGSGFGQEEGTFHFRTTILPPDDVLEDMIAKVSAFQTSFLEKYGSKGKGGYTS
eukprot:TRINITY_DN13311_c0_g1_i1.p1 TRINITY_DN13311_c0_g1~~TRINITY_DN13311_c0_g1_i1.p1  ORF type:complete len:544 (-),score=81.56 TRINITY_DN13311_c0_g1_i1:296-1834(-)